MYVFAVDYSYLGIISVLSSYFYCTFENMQYICEEFAQCRKQVGDDIAFCVKHIWLNLFNA